MRLASVALRELEWCTPQAFRSAAGSWSSRRGLLLELRDERGTVGLGEASPLPGRSRDDLASCARGLADALRPGLEIPDEAHALAGTLRTLAAALASTPAAAFSAETALLDLAARRRATSWRALARAVLGVDGGVDRAPICTVLHADEPGGWLGDAAAARARGVVAVKVKLGTGVLAVELRELARLREALGREVELRVDANARIRREDASRTLAALRALAPVTAEEVVAPGSPDWREAAGGAVVLAADESVEAAASDATIRAWLGPPGQRALVLKPSLVGGVTRTAALAALATAHGAAFWLSHALEGPVGYAACAELALALGHPGAPAVGLDRHRLLGAWGTVTPHFAGDAIVGPRAPGLAVDLAVLAAGAPR